MPVSVLKKTIIGISLLLTFALVGSRMMSLWQVNRAFIGVAAIGVGVHSNWASVEKQGQAVQLSTPDSIRMTQGLGKLYFLQGEFQKAILFLEQSLMMRPTDQITGLFLGEALWKIGESDRAIRVWRQVGAAAHFLSSGRSLTLAKQWNEAVNALKIAVLIDSTSAAAHFELGKALFENGQAFDAIQELEFALKHRAQNDQDEIQFLLGRAYDEAGQPDKALSAYQEAYARTQSDTRIAFFIGRLLFNQKRYDEAEHYLTAVPVDNRNAQAHYLLAMIYVLRGEYTDAENAALHAITAAPSEAAFQEIMGDIYIAQGRIVEGVAVYSNAYCLASTSPSVQGRIAQKLEQLAARPNECR